MTGFLKHGEANKEGKLDRVLRSRGEECRQLYRHKTRVFLGDCRVLGVEAKKLKNKKVGKVHEKENIKGRVGRGKRKKRVCYASKG